MGGPGQQHAPAAAATATATAPQAGPPGILGAPAGLSAPEAHPEPIEPEDDFGDPSPAGEGGGVFVPSMSTEGAAAGLLQLPDELREDKPVKGKGGGGSTQRKLLLGFLLLVIAASAAVAVAVFVFEWKPF
ncbi:MAG TPA: hypothetical protein DEA08_19095 [Planctomycetes bacterium]|nr:hypothetical protein [Planctomycetota bacterium]